MTSRRQARNHTEPNERPDVLPPRLAMGPCIEEWALPGHTDPAQSAWGEWRHALREWAARVGADAYQARTMARARSPWSRDWLISQGRHGEVDHYEGRAPKDD